MKQTESFENLQDAMTKPTIVERIEVQFNSIIGFLWLTMTGYWLEHLLNRFRK